MPTSARQTYNRLWRVADRLYGMDGQAPPELRVSATGSFGTLRTNRDGTAPVIYAKPWVMRSLAGKNKLNPRGFKLQMEKSLLHEWRHATQPAEVWNDIPTAESDASQFAQKYAPKLIAGRDRREAKQQNQRLKVKRSKNPGVIARRIDSQ